MSRAKQRVAEDCMMSAPQQDWTLPQVISHLHAGTFTIPNFQRDFVWTADLIHQLLWSILRDYHIGSLLVWEGTNKTVEELKCEEISRTTSDEPDPAKQLIVLDGQQRLTAMYRAFFAPDEPLPLVDGGTPVKVRFYLNVREFMAQSDRGPSRAAIEFAEVSASEAEYSDKAYKQHRFPFRLLSEEDRAQGSWIDGYDKYWRRRLRILQRQANEHAARDDEAYYKVGSRAEQAERFVKQIPAFGRQLSDLKQRRIRYVLLDKNEDPVRVKDTFRQLNRHGKQLTDFDLLNAVVAINGLSPRDLARDSEQQAQKAGLHVPRPNVESLATKIMLLRVHPTNDQDADIEPFLVPGERVRMPGDAVSHVLIPSSADFKSRWQDATDELVAGLRTLRDESRCSGDDAHHKYAPLDALTPNYCALLTDAGDDPVKKRKLRQWYWANLLMQRYEDVPGGSPMKGDDYREVLRWFESDTQKDEDAPSVVREFTNRFNPRRSHGMTRHSSRGQLPQSAVATGEGDELQPPPQAGAVLSLLRRRNPYDWRTGDYVRDAGHVVEAYIVPLSRCDEMGIAFSNSRSVFNSLLVSDEMLADIGDEMPHAYLPKIEGRWENLNWGGDKLGSVFRSHFLTPEMVRLLKSRQFTERTFEEFLDKRRSQVFRSFGLDLYNVDLGLDPSDRGLARWLDRIETRLKQVLVKFLAQENPPQWKEWRNGSVMWKLDRAGVFDDAEQLEREARLASLESAIQRRYQLTLGQVGEAVTDQFALIRELEHWSPKVQKEDFQRSLTKVYHARNELYHPPPDWTQATRRAYSVAARELYEFLGGG